MEQIQQSRLGLVVSLSHMAGRHAGHHQFIKQTIRTFHHN